MSGDVYVREGLHVLLCFYPSSYVLDKEGVAGREQVRLGQFVKELSLGQVASAVAGVDLQLGIMCPDDL